MDGILQLWLQKQTFDFRLDLGMDVSWKVWLLCYALFIGYYVLFFGSELTLNYRGEIYKNL